MIISIGLEREAISFNASHMIITSSFTEPLHGHNYSVSVEITGKTSIDELIIDFLLLKEMALKIINEWDHYVLLPKNNPKIILQEKKDTLLISTPEKKYYIPKEDIKILDCYNVTAESLCQIFAKKMSEMLEKEANFLQLQSMTIKLWEGPIFWAKVRIPLNS